MHERDNEYPNIKYSVAYIVQLTEHKDFFQKALLGISRLSAQVTFPIEHVPTSIFCKKGTHLELPFQVRIQDLVKGRAPGAEAESCRRSEAELREQSEQFAAGVQGPLKGPGSFWVFNAQICILPHSRDSFSLIFDIYFNTKS